MRRVTILAVSALFLIAGVYAQSSECEPSDLGYACKKIMADYYELHWSIGPTSDGAEAEDGEIAIAMVGQTSGWVGFAFAEMTASMAPSDFVIGWVGRGRRSREVVTPYRSEIQSITTADEDDSVTLTGTAGEQNSTHTIIQFVRSLSDGTVDIVLDEEIPVNFAIGSDDELAYHISRDFSFVTLGLASGDISTTPSPERTTPVVPSPPEEEETPESTEQMTADQPMANATSGGCTPSNIGYACMQQLGSVTVHWTTGPEEETADIPSVEEGEIAMATEGNTDGWVAIGFARSPGNMVPADAILGWVDEDEVFIETYGISTRGISPDDQITTVGIRDKAGSEVDGVTTLRFVLTGSFSFDVDLTMTVDLNWAIGSGDALAIHSSRGSATLNFASGESATVSPELKYFKTHGSMMIIAWIGLAPLGMLIARNKRPFINIHERLWFELHRGIQILALTSMLIGLVVALSEFEDPGTSEGRQHRKFGISIITISLFQGAMGILRPNHESPYRTLFNWAHAYVGRVSVGLGIATVFLGIRAFDRITEFDVDVFMVPCFVILGVYFVLGVIGEAATAMKCINDRQKGINESEIVHTEMSEM